MRVYFWFQTSSGWIFLCPFRGKLQTCHHDRYSSSIHLVVVFVSPGEYKFGILFSFGSMFGLHHQINGSLATKCFTASPASLYRRFATSTFSCAASNWRFIFSSPVLMRPSGASDGSAPEEGKAATSRNGSQLVMKTCFPLKPILNS